MLTSYVNFSLFMDLLACTFTKYEKLIVYITYTERLLVQV